MIHRLVWFFEGASHYLSVWLLRQTNARGYTKGLFLCGPPRCGTSWISDVLSCYYNLPRPKHYKMPLWLDAIVHTHIILGKKYVKQTYYASRYGLDAYFSRYLQIKNDIVNGKKFVGQKRYAEVFKDVYEESNDSINVRALIELDIAARTGLIFSLAKIRLLEKENDAVVINYDEAIKDPIKIFGKAIETFSGSVDHDRLKLVLSIMSKAEQRKLNPERRSTLINKRSSDGHTRLESFVIEFYDKQMDRIVKSYKL